MNRYYEALRSYRDRSVSIRHQQLPPSPLSASSPSTFASTASIVPSLLHHLPMVLTSSVMEWLYLNEMISLSLTSFISRQKVKSHLSVSRQLYCSSITFQSISLLKWC
jgi:uncharacterized membrane protein YgcG